MKKLLAILLVVVLVLSLCACKKSDDQKTPDVSQSESGNTENSSDNNTENSNTEGSSDVTDESTGDTSGDNAENNEDNSDSTPACTHDWKAATCTAAKTCSKCGATEGAAVGHSWKDATCTAAKTCSKCGATEGAAAGHTWKDATCTAAKTCSKCGATEGAAAGHTYTDGTCTACGTAHAVKDFEGELWQAYILFPAEDEYGEQLERATLEPDRGGTFTYKDFFEKNPHNEMVMDEDVYNGKTYYNYSFSAAMGGFEYEALANGNVKVDFVWGNGTVIELKKETESKFVVVASTNANYIPVGTVYISG